MIRIFRGTLRFLCILIALSAIKPLFAIPPGLYFISCSAGQHVQVYDFIGNLVGTGTYICGDSWTVLFNYGGITVAPPVVGTTFVPSRIDINASTTLSFTVINFNGSALTGMAGPALTGVGFTDTLPAGLVVATQNAVTNDCGGTVVACGGTNLISLTGATVPPGSGCVLRVNVTGISEGTQFNMTSPVTSNNGDVGLPGSASVTVGTALPATFSAQSPAVSGQAVKAMSIERVLQLNNIHYTVPIVASPSVLAALAAGALEIREISTLNPISGAITSVVFLVPTGTPFPTPAAVNTLDPPPLGSNVATFTLVPDKTYVTKNSVTFSGTILTSTDTPFGNYTGSPATLAFGLTNDTPPKITNVVELISGAVVNWSASATGSVTFSTPATCPAGGTVSVAVTPSNQTTLTTLAHIDSKATDSADPNATFTYQWVLTTPAGGGATIFTPKAASTDVQLVTGFNTYTFTVTAKNTKTGATGTGTATIQCVCAERR